jgi:hypothetical protein
MKRQRTYCDTISMPTESGPPLALALPVGINLADLPHADDLVLPAARQCPAISTESQGPDLVHMSLYARVRTTLAFSVPGR